MIRTGVIWSVILLAVMFGASAYAWIALPVDALVPVHWDAQGEVDRYGGKFEALLVMPIISTLLTFVMAYLSKKNPRKINLQKSRQAFLTGWLGTMALLAAVHILTIATALGVDVPVAKTIFMLLGILIVVLGNYVAKTRSNAIVGLRTKWTMSSEHAWTVGNRYLGRGMLITGILMVFAALMSNMPMMILLLLVGVLVSGIVSTIASYRAWKNDPEATDLGQ